MYMTPKDPHTDPKVAMNREKGQSADCPEADEKREVEEETALLLLFLVVEEDAVDGVVDRPPPPEETPLTTRSSVLLLRLDAEDETTPTAGWCPCSRRRGFKKVVAALVADAMTLTFSQESMVVGILLAEALVVGVDM